MARANFKKFDRDTMEEDFLRALSESGSYRVASASLSVNPREITKIRRDDLEFNEHCKQALDAYADVFRREARRRAVEGVVTPIIGGRNKDEVVAQVRTYSDSLMALFLKAKDPDFNPTQKVEISGNAVLELRDTFDYGSMSKEARALLRQLLVQLNKEADEREAQAILEEDEEEES